MPMYDDEVIGRMGCCSAPSPAPDGMTWHDPDCIAKKTLKGKPGHRFNAAKYEKYRLVPRPASPSPDFPTWTGWIAPNGDFYSCDYSGHNYLAKQICLALGLYKQGDWALPDVILGKLGWVEVHGANWKEKTEHFACLDYKYPGKATGKQVDTLFDLAVKYDNMKAFEQFKELNYD